jgi:hypothetical protein
MHDSTTYQYILDEGRLQEAHKLLLRLGRIQFGAPDTATEAAVRAITDLDRLERLLERLVTPANWQALLGSP